MKLLNTLTILCVIGLLSGATSYAQVLPPTPPAGEPENIDQLLENIVQDAENEEINYDTYFEQLNDYRYNPIDLNTADYEQLANLRLLSPQQINSLLQYRQDMNNFVSIYELQGVAGITAEDAQRIAPFVQINPVQYKASLSRRLFGGKNHLYTRYITLLETPAGYKDPTAEELLEDSTATKAFEGNKARYYLRYRYNYGTDISYGITAEKDPGEAFFTDSQKRGFDFYSAHFYARNLGRLKHLALGDYQVFLGQGLVAWTGFSLRKGSYVLNIARQSYPIRQYTSVDENNFFRGAAASIAVSPAIEVTAFGSYLKRDANGITSLPDSLAQATDEELAGIDLPIQSFSSLQASGYHRTPSEIENRRSLGQTNTGGRIAFKQDKFMVNANVLYTKYDKDITPSEDLYRKFQFSGDQLLNASIDYKILSGKFTIFGETAISDNGGIASLNGLLLDVDARLKLSILHRNYGKKYQTLFGNAFAESSTPINEIGTFFGAVISPLKYIKINAYFDLYRHPWLRFSTDSPSQGVDYLVELNYKPMRSVNMYVRYRNETKERNAVGNEGTTDYLVNRNRGTLRYHLQYKPSKILTLKTRVEMSWFENGVDDQEKGYLFYQDVNVRPENFPIDFSARYALFDTESFSTAIYAYENDVLYLFSVPAYYNTGSRYYLMAKYEASRNIALWLRFSQTIFENVSSLSSGNNEIEGNTRSELKAMMRLRF